MAPTGSRLLHDDPLQGRRGQIYGLVLGRPGITFMEIVRATTGHFGATAHHLYVLERFGMVRSYKTFRHRRYYAAVGDEAEQRRHAQLQEPHLRDTLAAIVASPGLNQKGAALAFPELTRQAVAARLRRLEDLDLVTAELRRRELRYWPSQQAASYNLQSILAPAFAVSEISRHSAPTGLEMRQEP